MCCPNERGLVSLPSGSVPTFYQPGFRKSWLRESMIRFASAPSPFRCAYVLAHAFFSFSRLLLAARLKTCSAGLSSAPADIKRLMAYAPAMNSEFIVSYFGTLSRETSIDVMKEMLGKNMRQNLQMVVQVRRLEVWPSPTPPRTTQERKSGYVYKYPHLKIIVRGLGFHAPPLFCVHTWTLPSRRWI